MIAMQEITKQVIEQISPTDADRTKVETLTHLMEQKVALACKEEGVTAEVRVEGSVAKDTWLRENPDIDIFMRLPTEIPRKSLGAIGLKIARKAAVGYEQIERFAEHPYLELTVEGYRVDIVPCYNAKPGEWQSATDRTPYHTDYIKQHLTSELKSEVRLLKQFMQGIGVYGAEIKVGGFSGYLCELLIMKYGSFAQIIEAFAHYSKRITVDIKDSYAKKERDLALLFPEPLVIVDPVDEGRNVASAVQHKKLFEFVAASRAFFQKPGEAFFFPPKIPPLSPEKLKRLLDSRGSSTVFIAIDQTLAVPDVLWGQLYRTQRALCKLVELSDFRILRSAVWSNEKDLSVFILELEQQALPYVKKHLGPPIEREPECESFLSKYSSSPQVIVGPYVEDGRWVIALPRKTTNAVGLLREKLADGGKTAGVADLVGESIREGMRIMVNGEIGAIYDGTGDFAIFLTEFLRGKPFWLTP